MKILITQTDGGVSVMNIAPRAEAARCLSKWQAAFPGLYLSHRGVADEDIPASREDRDHWADGGQGIEVLPPPLADKKAQLIDLVDNKIAGIYNRWLRFEAEYVAREAAAREFKAAGYVGDPGVWVTSFSSNTGMSNTAAANLIIGQADGLRTALQALGALRMAKYGIQAASTVAGAQAAHDSIIAQADVIAAAL